MIKDYTAELLKREGLDYKYVNKFTYKDENGTYGYKGKEYKIDILVKDDKIYLIEVKSSVEKSDDKWFDIRCKIISDVLKLKQEPVKMMVAITADESAVKRAKELGITIITEVIEPSEMKSKSTN